ncbi:hypothetical protein HXX76_008655 [Chlamydomonas incerta]|uniref:Uncharacterized protein n=1 Tax=Chlamydomonas incerta TaxID=51695 RepID=A0A835VYT0_CHLIN|nr:hypothetical protein HXX76_008655 [Chlamydomonas incerta]|eukprot:KAG2432925.1 hypothetical protein HXX76_008655 [Chlamydomonas incerta]
MTAHFTWAVFTYSYFFGTKRMKPQPQVKVGAQPAVEAAAAGQAASDQAASEAAVLPLVQKAADCLGRMVGTDGWCPHGEVSKAIHAWVHITRQWLDGSFDQKGWTAQQADAVHAAAASTTSSTALTGARVSAIRKPSPKPNQPNPGAQDRQPVEAVEFFPYYPLGVAGGYNENRPKCSLAKTSTIRDPSRGACGIPPNFIKTNNCALGYLVAADLFAALKQACESIPEDQEDLRSTLVTFLRENILQPKRGLARANIPREHLACGYPQLLASCVDGWERALTHVHRVWLPAVLQAYAEMLMGEGWVERLGGTAVVEAALPRGQGPEQAPGALPLQGLLEKLDEPQLILPRDIPVEQLQSKLDGSRRKAREEMEREAEGEAEGEAWEEEGEVEEQEEAEEEDEGGKEDEEDEERPVAGAELARAAAEALARMQRLTPLLEGLQQAVHTAGGQAQEGAGPSSGAASRGGAATARQLAAVNQALQELEQALRR